MKHLTHSEMTQIKALYDAASLYGAIYDRLFIDIFHRDACTAVENMPYDILRDIVGDMYLGDEKIDAEQMKILSDYHDNTSKSNAKAILDELTKNIERDYQIAEFNKKMARWEKEKEKAEREAAEFLKEYNNQNK